MRDKWGDLVWPSEIIMMLFGRFHMHIRQDVNIVIKRVKIEMSNMWWGSRGRGERGEWEDDTSQVLWRGSSALVNLKYAECFFLQTNSRLWSFRGPWKCRATIANMLIYSKERLKRVFTIKCESPEGIPAHANSPTPRSAEMMSSAAAASEMSSHSCDGTNRQRAPSVCLCGLIWPRPAQGASWGTAWKRSGVSHLGERGESVSLQISRSFTSLGGFISLLCNNTCWLPSCFAVIYNSAPLEFAEIPKATAQIR